MTLTLGLLNLSNSLKKFYLTNGKPLKKRNLTNSSSGIQHAWHFCHALFLVIKMVCGSIGIACFTP
ncbi:DUF3265 domain-containing protein [Vibrio parahaemolyticus]|nr:DUF3265 domain-containing protein [Vibrio parahaemolyticus]EHZ2739748.1 DUF3265 domain-containing protein [Vibrio parahaemolyticus]